MIKVIYNKVCGRCVQSEPLTSGMVGQTIEFEYSPDFDGLTLTAVFTNGKTTVDVLNPGNQCVIPHEVLDTVGTLVKVGIYAVRGNELVIPTVYANIGIVLKGADPSGDVSADPTLPVWAQTQAMIGNLNDLDTEAKNNLVAAVNEVKQTADGKQDKLIAGDNITIAADGKTISATGGGGGSISVKDDGAGNVEITEFPSGGGGGSTVELDTTLSETGKAADAKAVGDALAGKQDTISDLEAIRTGAAKGATALQSVPSTYRTASEQDTIDSGKVDKVTGKGLSSNDYTDAAKAKVDALAPVATSGSYNDLTDKPTIPTALPNPNALTFTGAVTGSYDGSGPMTVNIPEGGGGDGGTGAKEFRLIRSITLEEQSDRVDISVDSSGNAFALHEVYVMIAAQSYGNAENVNFLPNGRWGSSDAYIISSNKSSASTDGWKNNMVFHSVYADGIICSEQLPAKGQNNNLTASFATGQSIITKVSLVSKFAAGCTFLVIGR